MLTRCVPVCAGDIVGGGERGDRVRAHVGVRVGAARRRAGHAPVRRRGAARLHPGLGAHLPRRQLHAAVRAARRLPPQPHRPSSTFVDNLD